MFPMLIVLGLGLSSLMVLADDLPGDDPEDTPDPDLPEEGDGSDDLMNYIDARSNDGTLDDVDVRRGTDADESFAGTDELRSFVDMSGGDDTLLGGELNDTLIGGEDQDQILGGRGDDALFGGFRNIARADDEDADVLFGEAGDDTLFLGNGDTATGGPGADSYVLVADVDGQVTVRDFDVEQDRIIVEAPEEEAVEVASQTVTDDGLLIALSDGATILLEQLTEAIDPDLITILDPAA